MPWYTKSMRTKIPANEKRSATISAKVPPSIKQFVAELMALEDRTESYIVLALVERGIAQYRRDGLIIEPQRIDSHDKSSLKVPQTKKKVG